MLSINNLHAFYGKSHVLHGVSFDVQPGEIVALLGRNGSGRSTTAKAIMGLVDCQGSITWRNAEIMGKEAYKIAHLGIGYVPENRDIFPKLTVHQNLMLGQKSSGKSSRWSFDDMYSMFPRLLERQHTEAGVLSGGEQQMLTLCRTLMGDPDLTAHWSWAMEASFFRAHPTACGRMPTFAKSGLRYKSPTRVSIETKQADNALPSRPTMQKERSYYFMAC